ncbi:MAG: TonB-dependent receptor [Marinilabiliales bacterium]|nr:MAG: TonB-dependent receptor [Marinilabiliales bacterium]
MRHIIFIIAAFFLLPLMVSAQQGQRGQGGQQGQGRQAGGQQEVVVTGKVADASDDSPLIGAHLSFVHIMDTTRTFHTTTEHDGSFSLKMARGQYTLKVSYVGFQTLVLEGEEAVRAIEEVNDLGTIYLAEGAYLDEVEVTGYRSAARLRGDTLDFDAQAFKVNPDASAEDLVRRMPGITVEGGRVQAQGEDVRRVLVDGREFFGEDPSIALRNLPAEVIERIEVYDRMSDQSELTGFDDGERSKTINIVTRLDTRSGQFGRFYSGYGGDDRYQAGIATNIFMNDSRLSIIGMSNNVNEQNFSREDILSLAGGAIRGGRSGGTGGGMGRTAQGGGAPGGAPTGHVTDFRVGTQYGDNTTHALGLNYSDIWLDNRLNFTGSYFFNIADNITDQFTDRQYFIDDNDSQYYLEDSESSSRNSNHRMNLRMTFDIDDKNSVIFTPRLTMQSNTADSYLEARNLFEGYNLSESFTGYDSDLSGYNFGSSMVYRYRFDKTGRTISANMGANFNNNETLYYLDALSEYFAGEGDPAAGEAALSDYLNQRSDSETINNTLSSNINYTEPLGERSMLQVSYNISRAANETDRITNSYDTLTGSYTGFEAELSNRLSSNYLTQRGAAGILFRGDNFNLTAELGYQHASLTADQVFPYEFDLQRSFQNFLPRVMLTYNIERGKSLRFNYRTSTSPPSVTQLQEVVDNSNPMLLSSGNPNLDHSYSHFFMTRYNATNTEKSTNFMAFFFGNIANDHIGNSTIIARQDTTLANGYQLRKGSQFSQPVNLDGYANIRSNLIYGFPVRAIRSNLNLSSGLGWVRTPGLINDRTNISNTYSASGGLILSSNISPNVDFSVSYNASYNIVENTLQPQLDNNYFQQTSGTRFSFIVFNNWVLRSDISHIMYRGLGDDFNQEFFLWNMNVGRKLFNNNLGEITLSVFDLLDQNRNIVRNVSDSYIEDLRTNQLTRFFMLTFTYNLRNFNMRQS